VSLAFLTAATTDPAAPPAESPFASAVAAEDATFEVRDGWRVATRFAPPSVERAACAQSVGWADVSHLGKLEIQVAPGAAADLAALAGGLRMGAAVRARGAWWCLVTGVRALVLSDPAGTAAIRDELEASPDLQVLDVTSQFAALRLGGPLARETLARFCALDLRPDRTPVASFLPGSVARTPGFVLREADDQYLVLTGAALAEYLWSVVSDAGRRLGGRAVGADAFTVPSAPLEEAGTHA
jgi:heterotetrameric sarcosine oxidase gamma subunit